MKEQTHTAELATVDEIVNELRAKRMVVLVDDEDRENEGDLVMAAEHVTPDAINFMITHARGLVCLPMRRDRCEKLNLHLLTQDNRSKFSTGFTVSIEAARGVTTGISAADRAHTILTAIADNAVHADVVQPGHMFPIQAVDGGVLVRAGHTEASCDLAEMAECVPAAVICEIINDDGTMSRLPALKEFSKKHNLKLGSIADLMRYRAEREILVKQCSERLLKTVQDLYRIRLFQDCHSNAFHLLMIKGCPDASTCLKSVPLHIRSGISVLDALVLVGAVDTQSDAASPAIANDIANATDVVMLYMNCTESNEQAIHQFMGGKAAANIPPANRFEILHLAKIAQILKTCTPGISFSMNEDAITRYRHLLDYGVQIK